MSNSTTKPCIKCGSTERYKNGDCVPCKRERSRKWYKANQGVNRERGRRWDKANRKRRCEITLKWQRANPQKKREIDRKYRQTNPDKQHGWEKNNPEKANAITQRRRARLHGNESEPYDFKAICEHYNNRCVKCGELKPLTVDHIKPISKGGPDIASNIQPLCQACNSTKWTKNIDYRPDAGPLRWIQNKLFGGK